jgi:saccharopine dehydrogenase-like NADP-dependent oxidoreductase
MVYKTLVFFLRRAVDAGVLLLCECGLDPGIDHMLAMEIIDKVKAKGGKVSVTFFLS